MKNKMVKVDRKLLEIAINREPIKVARQYGYDVHRLSFKDVVDKADYIEGYRFRILKTVEGKPYPDMFMARNEKEIAVFLKRDILSKLPEKSTHIEVLSKRDRISHPSIRITPRIPRIQR